MGKDSGMFPKCGLHIRIFIKTWKCALLQGSQILVGFICWKYSPPETSNSQLSRLALPSSRKPTFGNLSACYCREFEPYLTIRLLASGTKTPNNVGLNYWKQALRLLRCSANECPQPFPTGSPPTSKLATGRSTNTLKNAYTCLPHEMTVLFPCKVLPQVMHATATKQAYCFVVDGNEYRANHTSLVKFTCKAEG